MKLELKHILPYLPYGLMVQMSTNTICELTIDETTSNKISLEGLFHYPSAKPILRPIEDFYEEIDGVSLSDMITHGYHNEFWWKDNFKVEHLMYKDFELLVSKHADVFGLIDKGLAIDIKTLK